MLTLNYFNYKVFSLLSDIYKLFFFHFSFLQLYIIVIFWSWLQYNILFNTEVYNGIMKMIKSLSFHCRWPCRLLFQPKANGNISCFHIKKHSVFIGFSNLVTIIDITSIDEGFELDVLFILFVATVENLKVIWFLFVIL